MIRALDYIFSARPMLHLPIWTVYLVTLQFSDSVAVAPGYHLVTLTALSLVVSGAYFINQVHDFDSDLINKKLGFLQRGYLTQSNLMAAYLVVSMAGLTLAFLQGLFVALVVLQQFVLGYLYSAPPWRFKDRPWLGLLVNAYCFGFLIPLCVIPHPNAMTLASLVLSVYFFLAVAAIHIVTTVPDRAGDGLTGKVTIVVRLGQIRSLALAAALLIASTGVAYMTGHSVLTAPALLALALTALALGAPFPPLVLAIAKLPLLLLTAMAGIYCPYYLLIVVAMIFATRIYYRQRFGLIYPQLI